MGLSSAPVFSAPPVYYVQQHKHLQQALRAPFIKSCVGKWNNNHIQSLNLCKGNKFKVCSSQVETEDSLSDETCELVNGTELTIGDEENGIRAYLCTAVKNNNSTGIILLSDIFGFEDSSTRDFAYRVACNGYNVLVPDLFKGDPWTKDRPMSSFQEWLTNQNHEQITKDVFTSANWMVNEFAEIGITNKLGIIGFCFGGGRVIDVLAQDKESSFGSGISFYGTGIDLNAAGEVKVPLLLVAGDDDALCPVSVLEEVVKRNEELMKTVVFKGRGHGFVHRPQCPEEDEDAEEAFVLMRNWLSKGLFVQS